MPLKFNLEHITAKTGHGSNSKITTILLLGEDLSIKYKGIHNRQVKFSIYQVKSCYQCKICQTTLAPLFYVVSGLISVVDDVFSFVFSVSQQQLNMEVRALCSTLVLVFAAQVPLFISSFHVLIISS